MPMEDNIFSIIFLIIYLSIIFITLTIAFINRPKLLDFNWKLIFWSFLILAIGDLFHLIPRVYLWYLYSFKNQLNIYKTSFGIFWYGFGLVLTSITLTIFYLCMYLFWRNFYIGNSKLNEKSILIKYKSKIFSLDFLAIFLTISRLGLISLPWNSYGSNPIYFFGWLSFRYISNIPLYLLGSEVIILFIRTSKSLKNEELELELKNINDVVYKSGLWFLVSYICYSITLFGVKFDSKLGMFMIPKTIAYIIVLFYFYKNLLRKR